MTRAAEPASRVAQVLRTLGLDTPTSDGAPRKRRVWLAAGALGALLLLGVLLGGNGEGVRYTTEAARRGGLRVTVTATGALQPTNQVDVGSELSGTVRSVEVDFNDRVTRGQVLARLDTTRLEAQVLQSDAALAAARARVTEAEAAEVEAKSQLARLARVRELSGGKVPSQSEYASAEAAAQRTRAARASALAAVRQAQATLDAQRTDLSKAEIRSPIDGIVLARSIEPGQTVAASLQAPILFTLAEDLTRMELLVSVDEADVGQVREGQEAQFGVDAWPERSFAARVEQLRYGAQAAEGVVSYQAVLRVENPELLLRPGMTATAEIRVRELSDALLVPNSALRFVPPQSDAGARGGMLRAGRRRRGGGGPRAPATDAARERQPRVWALRRGAPQEIELTTGSTDGQWTEVTGGAIEAGDELIVASSGGTA
jgi:HlyD family secretion protein